jgi:ATP-binding cassette subfamily F protein uup
LFSIFSAGGAISLALQPAILTVQNLEKSFGARRVLAGVSFAVHADERIALVGLNGSGKSTLMRLLVGQAELREEKGRADDGPDAGLITRRRSLYMEYVPQEPWLPPEFTVEQALRQGLRRHAALQKELAELGEEIENSDGEKRDVALLRQAVLHEHLSSLQGWDVEHEIRGLAAALLLPPLSAPVGRLSIGERRRVALAAALLSRPELLLLDEPTNHLDARTVEWLEGRLRAQPGALVLVTHDRYFLDRVATRILELDRGQVYSYEGNYRRFLEKQAERLDAEEKRDRERAMFVRRELDWIRRGPPARSTKQKARIDRFNDAAAADKQSQSVSKLDRRLVLRLPTGGRMGKTILEMRNLRKTLSGKLLFANLTQVLKPGDRIGVVGGNGAGKTTLLRTLLGEVQPDEGEVVIGQNTRVAFLDQGRAELNDARSVLEEVSGDSDTVYLGDEGEVHVRTFLRMLLFDDRFADAKVGSLSGGERNRVQLAKLLRRGGNLLILDEPTNDLDLLTLAVVEEALVEFPGCVIVVSHDRWFLDRVATGILAFDGAGGVVFHEGNFSDYLARIANEAPLAAGAPRGAPKGTSDEPASKPAMEPAAKARAVRRITFNEQRELATLEEKITQAEARVKELEASLNDPAIYKERGAEVPVLLSQLETQRAEVDRLYSRWQELESLPKK